LVKYDAATNAFVFPANAVFEGGIAWNTKLEGFEKQTITAAVQVDWKTIGKNENGELYVIGGTSGGGGGVVGGVTLDEVKNYLTAEKYTTETWVSSQNYATQSWVTNKGYITGITGSMVTSALGYTPLDSANFTKSKIKSTLGISDWALASVKPSYKFSEITEKPITLAEYGITDAYTKTQVDSALAKKWTQDDSLIANWNTAYDWGNHALAGYAKQGDVTSELGKYVTLATAQTITGIKDFSNGFKVGGTLVSYNASKNAFILPANVIIEGGVAWNSKIGGFDVPTIMDAVVVDGETITKENGKLKVIGDVSGGINESQLGDYLTRNNYAKKSDIPSLSGYATESFVVTQGYITSASLPTRLSDLTDDVVSGNYLSLAKGGVVSQDGYWSVKFKSTGQDGSLVGFETKFGHSAWFGYGGGDTWIVTNRGWNEVYTLLHSDNYSDYALPKDGIAVAANVLKSSATANAWTVGKGNGIDCYNSHATQRYWFGFAKPEGSPYATTKWVFGASDSSGRADGEVYAKHISIGYGNDIATGGYALRANGNAKIDGSLTVNGGLITYDASLKAFVLNGNLIVKGGIAWEKQNS
jgi:hypothetical protein